MGMFRRHVEKSYDEEEIQLPPVPPEEIGEVQNLAKLIWEFESHGVTWEDLRSQHERGLTSASHFYKDRIAIANHILKKYEPRPGPE